MTHRCSSLSPLPYWRTNGEEQEPSYYRARYYDPQTGRFLKEDPARISGDVNFYRYSYNNSINFTDPFGLKACKSGKCNECPNGNWVSGFFAADAYVRFGPIRVGGLAFAGVFVCTSNPTFNVPWYTLCGQGFSGVGLPKESPIPMPKIPGLPASVGNAIGKLKGGGGAGGGFVRCKGAPCREDLSGPEGGGFAMVGTLFGFREGTGGATCTGLGAEAGAGFAVGGFGCRTSIGRSWTF